MLAPRSLLSLLSLLLLLASSSGAGAGPNDEARCAAERQRGFGALHAVRARLAAACLRDAGGSSLEGCLAADPRGEVARAEQQAVEAEARACGGAGESASPAAAARLEAELLRGLFGVAAPVASGAAGRCQQRLLLAANACAASHLDGFAHCAAAAAKAGDADLLACKHAELDPAACGARIESAAAACEGEAPGALFPGCATDLVTCARSTARWATSRAQNAAAGLCADALPGALDETTLLACFAPPPREPVAFGTVPLPSDVNPGAPSFDKSGERLFFSFTSPAHAGPQLGTVREDGSDFRCITCDVGVPDNVRSFRVFDDGRRVLVASANNRNPTWLVLECAPSVLACDTFELLPIELPENPDPPNLITQYRVPHVSHDGEHFVWTEVRLRGPGNFLSALGRLERAEDRYVVTEARIIAPTIGTLELGDDAKLWQRFTANWEAKDAQLRGGRDWVVAGTPLAGQYDDVILDLATGETRPMTHHPDHDEGASFTTDEEWLVLASARGNERVEFLGLVPRPPYIDGIAFSAHFVALAGQPGDGVSPGSSPAERDCYIEPWLLDRWGQRGDYLGQELLVPGSDGYEPAPSGEWHPDGTRLVLLEQRWKRLTPPGEVQPSRLRIARLTNRVPIEPAAVVPIVPTPEPSWAVRYADWILPDTRGVTAIPGRAAGVATLTNAMPTVLSGEMRVDYAGYSDDGVHFLDGFERIRVPSLISRGAEYEADLVRSGPVPGSLRGAAFYDFVADVNTGNVVAELGARRIEGPRSCAEAGLLPPLAP